MGGSPIIRPPLIHRRQRRTPPPGLRPSLRPKLQPNFQPDPQPNLQPNLQPNPTESPTRSPTMGGVECKDGKLRYKNNKKQNCKWVRKGPVRTVRRKCTRKWKRKRIHEYCPRTCGSKAGVGQCKHLKRKRNQQRRELRASNTKN